MQVLFTLFFVLTVSLSCVSGEDWLQWRGPNKNGKVDKQSPPVQWDTSTNLLWKTKVPGRGHSSPTVVGNLIFLTTADKEAQTQSVLCFDRAQGRRMWTTLIHKGELEARIHQKNTHASPSVASDGTALFVVFNNAKQIFLTKLSFEGKVLWQQNCGTFKPYYPFGFAASPTIWKDTVIVTAECEKLGFLTAYNKDSGKKVWTTERHATSYSSPIVANVAGRDQLLLSGGSAVSGYDPDSGKKLWSAPANWQVSCGTLVWDKERVFASGGYPRAQTLCVKADGSGEILWKNRVKCYEQSMLVHEGYLYGISDSGIGYCWRATDGKEMWKQRMEGPVSCSPILAGGNIYYSSEKGTTFVFKPTPNGFEQVAKNKLGISAFATPAFCDNLIYTRVAFEEDRKRQEYLICIGNK